MEKMNKVPCWLRGLEVDHEYSALSCDKEVDEFGYYFDDDGVRCFGVIGKRNVYDEIQRDKDSTDFSMLKAYLMAHSDSYRDKGIYGERPDILSDVNDMAVYLRSANDLYNSLPDVIKDKYKNMIEVVNGFSEEDLSLLKDSGSSVQPTSENSEVAKDE